MAGGGLSEEGEGVVLRTTLANDWTYAIIGFVAAAFVLWVVVTAILDLAELDAAALFSVALLLAGGVWCLGQGLWRLIDRRPVIEADASGLRFHPSMRLAPAAWSEVRRIRTGTEHYQGLSASYIAIDFHRPFWSAGNVVGGRTVSVTNIAARLSYREAQAVAKLLRAMKKAASP